MMNKSALYTRGVLVACVVAFLVFSLPASAAITGITGNKVGITPDGKDCPVHSGNHCQSALVPSTVTLLSAPTAWFQNLLGNSYNDPSWHFNYVGGNDNVIGTFDVVTYKAYDDCHAADPAHSIKQGLLGAEIKVNFVPDPSSLIQDILWISSYSESWPGQTGNAIDVVAKAGALPGPFYPYQDADQPPSKWQSNYGYDYFYDKPGDPCPTPFTTTSLRFQTYATFWDDYFNADGTIEDVGNNGHNVWIHEGFSWGYDLTCVPEPSSILVIVMGSLGVFVRIRRKAS